MKTYNLNFTCNAYIDEANQADLGFDQFLVHELLFRNLIDGVLNAL